jgi:hypothetical protein
MTTTDDHPPERDSLDPEVDAVDLMPEGGQHPRADRRVERSRQLRAGLPAHERLQPEPRAAPRPGAVERLHDTIA